MVEGVGHDVPPVSREDVEIDVLLEAVYRFYGFDFRSYARASIRRRLWRRVRLEGLATLSALQERLLHEPGCMERLLLDLSINVTAMFRDPTFWLAFRREVVPLLHTYPFLRVWSVGCSTGEEVYSLAILLHEEGLSERTRIYATDMNETVLSQAATGLVPLDRMKEYTENYQAAGGTRAFSEYYVTGYQGAQFDRELTGNIVFAHHNLVTDGGFNEFHVIMCRNVLIYFDTDLQQRVHRIFYDSLVRLGILALGPKESVTFTEHGEDFDAVDGPNRIYRKVR